MESITSATNAFRRQALAPTGAPAHTSKDAPAQPADDRISAAPGAVVPHAKIARARQKLLTGADPLSKRSEGPAPTAVVGVSHQGIGLVGGRLHAWDAQDRSWKPSGAAGIVHIKLGANNDQVWALGEQGDLRQVDADGALHPDVRFRLAPDVRDFALSPTAGAVSFIGADGALQRQAHDGKPAPLPLPSGLSGQPATLAQTGNGDLYLASDAGQIWRLPGHHTAPEGDAWTRIDVPASGRAGAVQPAGQLQVLREGQLAAQDRNGRLLAYDPIANAWSDTTPHARGAYRTGFDRLPGGAKWNHVLLNGSVLEFFRLGLPSPDNKTPGHGEFEAVQATLRTAMGQLGRKPVHATPAVAALAPDARDAVGALLSGPAGGVDAASGRALAVLEAGASQLPRSTDANLVHDPDRNTLCAVYQFRVRVLGRKGGVDSDDPVTARLAALLKQGVHLPVGHPDTMILMGKVLADHALVRQAIEDHGGAARATHDGAPLGRVDDAGAARVTTLFDAGMMDAEQFRRTGAASERLNAGLAAMAPGLVKAIHPLEGADADEIGARFAEQVCNLRPGKESISLNFNHSAGVDLEGLWMFFNLSSETVGHAGKHVLSANKLPILTPLATASKEGSLNLALSRTDRGVQVVLGDARKTAGSLGVRAQMRYGGVWEKAQGHVALLAVAGVEGAIIPGGAVADERSVTLEFDQDDHGKAQAAIADLASGKASLTELLQRADRITNARGDSFNVNAEGYVHVFGALRANYGESRQDLPEGNFMAASNLVVPALDQLTGRINYDAATRSSRDQQGATTHNSKKGVSGTVDFNHISVVDVSTWFSLPFGKDRSTQIQWKVPALLWVANHNIWNNKLDNKDGAVQLAADGSFKDASVTLHTRDALARSASADKPLTPALFPQLATLVAEQPGIQPFLDRLNGKPGLRPSVTLTLTPAALAGVQARIAQLAASGLAPDQARAALLDAVNQAMGQAGNLRIARIDVAATKTRGELAIQAFGPLRATRSQSHTFAEAGSSISVQYHAAGAATGFKADGKEVLGHDLRPNLAALDELR